MKKIVFSFAAAFGLALIFAAGASAQRSVAGEWDATMNTPGGPRPFKLDIKVDGEKLSGTAIRTNGNVPISGTVKGDDIAFSYTISYNGHDLTLSFTGKVSGDKITGIVSFAGQAEDEWGANRSAEKPKEDKP